MSAFWFAVCALALVAAYFAFRVAMHAVWQSAFGNVDMESLRTRAIGSGLVCVAMIGVAGWSAIKLKKR